MALNKNVSSFDDKTAGATIVKEEKVAEEEVVNTAEGGTETAAEAAEEMEQTADKQVDDAEARKLRNAQFITSLNIVKADANIPTFETVLQACNIEAFADAVTKALTDEGKAGAYAATALTEQYGTLYVEGPAGGANVHLVHPYRDSGKGNDDSISFIDITMPKNMETWDNIISTSLRGFKDKVDILNHFTLQHGISDSTKLCLLQTGVSLKEARPTTRVLNLSTYSKEHLEGLLSNTYKKSFGKIATGTKGTRVYADYAVVSTISGYGIVNVTGKKREFDDGDSSWEYYKGICPTNSKLFTGSHFLALMYNRKISEVEECASLASNWFLEEMRDYFGSKSVTNINKIGIDTVHIKKMIVQYLPTLQAAFMTGCVPKISMYYVDKEGKEVETTWQELLARNSANTLLWSNYNDLDKGKYLNRVDKNSEPCCSYTVIPQCKVTFEVPKTNITADFRVAVRQYIVDLCTQIIGYMYYNAYQLDIQRRQLALMLNKLHSASDLTVYAYVQVLKKIKRLLDNLAVTDEEKNTADILKLIIKVCEGTYINKNNNTVAFFDGIHYRSVEGIIPPADIAANYNKCENNVQLSLYSLKSKVLVQFAKLLEEKSGVAVEKPELNIWIASKFGLRERLKGVISNIDLSLCEELSTYWSKLLQRRVSQLLTNVIYVSNFDSSSKGVYRCRMDNFGYMNNDNAFIDCKFSDYSAGTDGDGSTSYNTLALYSRAPGTIEEGVYKRSTELTALLTGNSAVNEMGLHACGELFGNASGVMCATSKGFICDFVLRGYGDFDTAYSALNYCGSYAYVFNKDEYSNSTLFGYKALEMMSLAGVKPSIETCYIGQNMDGSFRGLDLTKADISLSAGSRSGKGTVTNCIIASMVSSKSSIVYIDGKPDVSGNIMNLGRYFGAPVLTAECLALPYLNYGNKSPTADFKFEPIGGVDNSWFKSYKVANKFKDMPGESAEIVCGICDLRNGDKLNRYRYTEFNFEGVNSVDNANYQHYEKLLSGIIDTKVALDGGEKATVAPAFVLLKMLNLIGFVNNTNILNSPTPYLTALKGMYARAPRIFVFIDEINNISLSLSKALAWVLGNLYIAPIADACVNTVNPFGREGGKAGIHSADVWGAFKLMLRLPKNEETPPTDAEQILAVRNLEKESMSLGLVTALFNMLDLYVNKGSSDKIGGVGNEALRTVYVGQHIAADKLRGSANSVRDCVNWFTSSDGGGGVSNVRGFTYYKLANRGWLADESLTAPTDLSEIPLMSDTYLDTLLLKQTTAPSNIRIRGRAYLDAELDKCSMFKAKNKTATKETMNVIVDKMQSGNGYLNLEDNMAKTFLGQTGMFGVADKGARGLDKNLFKSYAVFNTNDIFDNLVCSVIDGGLTENLFSNVENSVGFVLTPEVISNENFLLYAECKSVNDVVMRIESYDSNGRPLNLKVIKYAPKVISGVLNGVNVSLTYAGTDAEFANSANCFKFKQGSTTDVDVKINGTIKSCRLFEAAKCTLAQFVKDVGSSSTNIHKAFINICIGNLASYNVGLDSKSLSNAIVGRTVLELDSKFKPIGKLKTGWQYVLKDLVEELKSDDGTETYLVPRSEVGFLDYIKTFMRYFACKGGVADLTEFADSLGYGYWYFTALLKDVGIIGQGTPYVTIEDWLYDYSTSSFFPLVTDVTIYKKMLTNFGVKPYSGAACKLGIATGESGTKTEEVAMSAEDRAIMESRATEEEESGKKKTKSQFTYKVSDIKLNFDSLMSYIVGKLEEPAMGSDTADIALIRAYHDLYIECAKYIANGYTLNAPDANNYTTGTNDTDEYSSTSDSDLEMIRQILMQNQKDMAEQAEVTEQGNQSEPIVEEVVEQQSSASSEFKANMRFVTDWSIILSTSNTYDTVKREWGMYEALRSSVESVDQLNITQVQTILQQLREVTSSLIKNTSKLENSLDYVMDKITNYSMDDVIKFIHENTDVCASMLETIGNIDVNSITVANIEEYFEYAVNNIVTVANELNNTVEQEI